MGCPQMLRKQCQASAEKMSAFARVISSFKLSQEDHTEL